METELNMSPEGKLRRKAIYQKDEANKHFEEFKRQYSGADEDSGTLNLSLKKTGK